MIKSGTRDSGLETPKINSSEVANVWVNAKFGNTVSRSIRKKRYANAGQRHCGAARLLPSPESRVPSPVALHHLTFNVARPTSTSTTEMIQKRTITRGSGQPFNSKW